MTDYRAIAARYLAAWNEPDGHQRRALIEDAWAPDGSYADPMMTGEGRDGIAEMIDAARAQFPGFSFALRGEPEGHGANLRFSWTLAPEGGIPTAGGTDFATLDEGGQLRRVTGFLDVSTALAAPVFMVAHLRDVSMGPAIVDYLQRIDSTLTRFGGRFRVHGGPTEVLEGAWSGDLIAIEFPNREKAKSWYASEAYQTILSLRRDNSSGEVILVDTVPDTHRATDILNG